MKHTHIQEVPLSIYDIGPGLTTPSRRSVTPSKTKMCQHSKEKSLLSHKYLTNTMSSPSTIDGYVQGAWSN